ncbi:MAG: GNAT family N-acetyltransferase [Planctomycetes bacterium]|nr:GNAT family N-acetyltransferase [Planctomycetota bacterium]
MKLSFSLAAEADGPELAALHRAAAEELFRTFGKGPWTSASSLKGQWFSAKNLRVVVARKGRRIVGTLDLHTKKPWAIDVSYFAPVKKPLYLTSMAVFPTMQRKGIGRQLLEEAVKQARSWPADAIRLDAFDADAGAGEFYAKCGLREVGRVTYRKAPLIYFEKVLTK